MTATKRSPGRPATVEGKPITVWLPGAAVVIAARLGGGNVSAGIREALRFTAESKGLDLIAIPEVDS